MITMTFQFKLANDKVEVGLDNSGALVHVADLRSPAVNHTFQQVVMRPFLQPSTHARTLHKH